MTEDQSSANAVDPPAAEEDPAGEVMFPVGRIAIIRAQLLAGAVIGLTTIMLPVPGGREITSTYPAI